MVMPLRQQSGKPTILPMASKLNSRAPSVRLQLAAELSNFELGQLSEGWEDGMFVDTANELQKG